MRPWVFALLFLSTAALGHVGSPDVYYEGQAGPYHLLVTVNPPPMIPGVAQVQVRATAGAVSSISLAPVYINGKDQGMPPAPDVMQPVPGDPQSFTGSVWLMASGSWEVRAEVNGAQGPGKLSVPVPAFARRTLPMEKALGTLLFGLMLVLSLGVVSIAGAAVREGVLEPGTGPSNARRRLGRIAMLATAVLVVGILALGNWWWNAEAADLKLRMLYDAPPLTASFDGGGKLSLRMGDNTWHHERAGQWSMNLISDHGHLVHLFLLRTPALDRFYHLHPQQAADGSFAVDLPPVSAGQYKIFADIVRGSGFPETMVSEINLPDLSGKPLTGDDSAAETAAFSVTNQTAGISQMPDGSRMVWEREGTPLKAGQVSWLRFRVEDAQGKAVDDLEPYMGMAGHAEFVRSDLSVFAHIHPAGSVPMASLMIVQKDAGTAMDNMPGMHALPAEISFPYGFPKPGDYRLFVQVKKRGQIATGIFDAHVGS